MPSSCRDCRFSRYGVEEGAESALRVLLDPSPFIVRGEGLRKAQIHQGTGAEGKSRSVAILAEPAAPSPQPSPANLGLPKNCLKRENCPHGIGKGRAHGCPSLTRERARVWVFGRCQIHKRTGAERESRTVAILAGSPAPSLPNPLL